MWEKLGQRLHWLLLLGSVSLVLGSPWIVIGRQLRPAASLADLWHVYVGLALLPFSLLFFIKVCVHGQWRLYFPYLAGNLREFLQDIASLFRGRLPVAGGAGLFSVIEGLLVLSLFGCCLTGGLWFLQQGGSDALFWRDWHANFAVGFVVLLVAHVLGSALHLINLVR